MESVVRAPCLRQAGRGFRSRRKHAGRSSGLKKRKERSSKTKSFYKIKSPDRVCRPGCSLTGATRPFILRRVPDMWFWVSRDRFNSNLVVHGFSQSLFAAEIFFSGLHRDVAQQKLNLFQFAPSTVAETSARSSKVVWREF